MNSPKVAQDIKMQRAGFDAFRSSLAQAFEVPFAGRQFDVAQISLLFDQAPGRLHVAGHKGTKGDPQAFANALMK